MKTNAVTYMCMCVYTYAHHFICMNTNNTKLCTHNTKSYMSKLHIYTFIYMYKIYIFFTSTLLSITSSFSFLNLTWVFFYSILHLWLFQIGFRIRLTISNGHPLGLWIGICDCYSGWPVLSFPPSPMCFQVIIILLLLIAIVIVNGAFYLDTLWSWDWRCFPPQKICVCFWQTSEGTIHLAHFTINPCWVFLSIQSQCQINWCIYPPLQALPLPLLLPLLTRWPSGYWLYLSAKGII